MTKDTTNKTHGQAKKSESKIHKPPNSFILWKNQLCPDTTATPRQRLESMPKQAVFQCLLEIHGFLNYLQSGKSRLNGGAWVSATGRWWNSLTDEERQPWEDEATRVEKRHALKYPRYKLRPSSKASNKRRKYPQVITVDEARAQLPIAMRLLRGSDQTVASNIAATQTSYGDQAYEQLNRAPANGPVPAQTSHQRATTPPRGYLNNPSLLADQHPTTSHQLAYYPGMMQQMLNTFGTGGQSPSFQASGTGFGHDNQLTGANDGFDGPADGLYHTLTAPEMPQVDDQYYFSFPLNGFDTGPNGTKAEMPDGNTSSYSTAYNQDNDTFAPVQTIGGPYSGSLHNPFHGYQNIPYEADENQMPGSVAGLYNPAFNQTQGAFEQTPTHAANPVALQAMQIIEGHGPDRTNEWSSQLGNLAMTSPFNDSGRTTPEDDQEGSSSTALGTSHPQRRYSGDIPLAYSREEMAAFELSYDPADFNLSGFTYNEPEGFERSARIIPQLENNATAAGGSQWNLDMF